MFLSSRSICILGAAFAAVSAVAPARADCLRHPELALLARDAAAGQRRAIDLISKLYLALPQEGAGVLLLSWFQRLPATDSAGFCAKAQSFTDVPLSQRISDLSRNLVTAISGAPSRQSLHEPEFVIDENRIRDALSAQKDRLGSLWADDCAPLRRLVGVARRTGLLTISSDNELVSATLRLDRLLRSVESPACSALPPSSVYTGDDVPGSSAIDAARSGTGFEGSVAY